MDQLSLVNQPPPTKGWQSNNKGKNMKILIMSEFGDAVVKQVSFVPRVGDNIDVFYTPYPTVIAVLCFPSKKTIEKFNNASLNAQAFDAIVTVS